MKKTNKKNVFNQQIILILLLGLLLGLIIFSAIRLYKYSPEDHVHYHANFQVWVNGEQEKFESPLNYQEVNVCTVGFKNSPLHRTHMHDDVYDIIHVHASAVTWGHFFENINSSAQPGYLRLGEKIYQNNLNNKVSYILNGKEVPTLNGLVINSEDTLLINYGVEDKDVLQARYKYIENKAHSYNLKNDPASCGGSDSPSLSERWNHLFN